MWPDGRRYEGKWYQGKPIGTGIKTYADGTSKKGKWEGGVFISLDDDGDIGAEVTKAEIQNIK